MAQTHPFREAEPAPNPDLDLAALRQIAAALSEQIAEQSRRLAGLLSAAQGEIAALSLRLQAAEERVAQIGGQTSTLEKLVVHPLRPHHRLADRGSPSPRIAVIMPTHNRARIVPDAIMSVVAQDLAQWQLIIVDDGSDDDTEAAVAPFLADARIRYFRQVHAGAGAARNRGLREAGAPVVAFLDSDNLYFPGFLAAAVAAFEEEPTLATAYGILASRHHGLVGTELLFRPFDREALLRGNFIDTNTLICRKSAVDAVGGFDESLERLEDWDLVLRLTADAPARPLPVLATYYRVMDTIRMTDRVPMGPALDIIARKLGPSFRARPPGDAESSPPPAPSEIDLGTP